MSIKFTVRSYRSSDWLLKVSVRASLQSIYVTECNSALRHYPNGTRRLRERWSKIPIIQSMHSRNDQWQCITRGDRKTHGCGRSMGTIHYLYRLKSQNSMKLLMVIGCGAFTPRADQSSSRGDARVKSEYRLDLECYREA